MRRKFALKTLLAATALAVTAAGCSAATADANGGSARGLAGAAGQGRHVDYTPLSSPADAVGKADLIVSGTLVDVTDGIRLVQGDRARDEREEGAYATFVIDVDRVLDGDARQVTGGRVYVSMRKNRSVTPNRLAELNPKAEIVAVLDDITGWRPDPVTAVRRPSAIPAAAPLYAPYTDGIWLQGERDDEMFGITVEHSDLPPSWGSVRDVEQFKNKIEAATPRN
ncbi:hypothetical protein [Actinomadura sediminis]|uniref:Secreted protein n=1 Tax=Actinomadura sediminis TaxID=1038904 RepID=A0ABW3EM46_9ACTN